MTLDRKRISAVTALERMDYVFDSGDWQMDDLAAENMTAAAAIELQAIGYHFNGNRWREPQPLAPSHITQARAALHRADDLSFLLRHVLHDAIAALARDPLPGPVPPKDRVLDALIAYRQAADTLRQTIRDLST
jgi:hypothetical protein